MYLSDIIYNDGTGTSHDINFSLALDGMRTGLTATLVMEIQSVRVNV
jgi:hypothetical protein